MKKGEITSKVLTSLPLAILPEGKLRPFVDGGGVGLGGRVGLGLVYNSSKNSVVNS